MACYVYVLRSERDGATYTGCAANLLRRFVEHRGGHVRSTRNRRPLTMVYWEAHPSRIAARARETYFKTAAGGVEKQRLLAGSRLMRGSDCSSVV
ncbi:MAG: GIY-YIG nuclease family protein [Phycisphaerae bacterium]|nr:GIY-YIG nuclease family protein [Phycisphaerae bacterium]